MRRWINCIGRMYILSLNSILLCIDVTTEYVDCLHVAWYVNFSVDHLNTHSTIWMTKQKLRLITVPNSLRPCNVYMTPMTSSCTLLGCHNNARTHIRTHVCTYACTHLRTHVCTHLRMYVDTHASILYEGGGVFCTFMQCCESRPPTVCLFLLLFDRYCQHDMPLK